MEDDGHIEKKQKMLLQLQLKLSYNESQLNYMVLKPIENNKNIKTPLHMLQQLYECRGGKVRLYMSTS